MPTQKKQLVLSSIACRAQVENAIAVAMAIEMPRESFLELVRIAWASLEDDVDSGTELYDRHCGPSNVIKS